MYLNFWVSKVEWTVMSSGLYVQVQDKFRLDLSDEQAVQYMQWSVCVNFRCRTSSDWT